MSAKENQRLDILATISGVMIALQARANGELSHRLNNGVEAALISFGSGLLIIAVIALFSPAIKEGARNLRGAVSRRDLPRWTLFAGALGGTFVAIQTHVVPVIGVAIYSVASIAGQTAASLLVDRLGITGGGKKHITSRRFAAAIFTVFAVFISVLDRIEAADLALFAVFLAGVAGAVVGVQRALNGQINEHSFTPCKPLTIPPWMARGFERGDLVLANVRLSVTRGEVETAMERVAIMTAEQVTEFDAQTQALLELNARRRQVTEPHQRPVD